MDIYVVENRDVQECYMSIEDIFKGKQSAINNSKVIGEPFWHEIAVVKHTLQHQTEYVFVVQEYASPKYKVFNYENEALLYAKKLGLEDGVCKYKLKD